jgi:hypothetical protein
MILILIFLRVFSIIYSLMLIASVYVLYINGASYKFTIKDLLWTCFYITSICSWWL